MASDRLVLTADREAARARLEAQLRAALPPAYHAADLRSGSDRQLKTYAEQLDAWRHSCGCHAGEVGVLVSLAAALLDLIRAAVSGSGRGWLAAALEVTVAAFVGGGVGKAAGIGSARVRSVVLAHRIAARGVSR